ncbi:uncharacterized protein LOC128546037 [Mercenaria mercenaria]|uniref:uncharacterized protein LOC128546037 n=1 Tax=Mercenaria mercenaria TaxID=6596 RepID=UPI00234EBDD4|nr:uncharacterized protein LOC128546037 [Mercenaria mercenaria]
MAGHGIPMTRTMSRCYIREVIRKSGRDTTVNQDSGPSDKWFRGLMKRHPELSESTPENMGKSRTRMSSQKTRDVLFQVLDRVLEENGIKNKKSQIFNVDGVGFSGNERQRSKVIGPSQGHVFTSKTITNDHVTVNMCICGDGKTLPSM